MLAPGPYSGLQTCIYNIEYRSLIHTVALLIKCHCDSFRVATEWRYDNSVWLRWTLDDHESTIWSNAKHTTDGSLIRHIPQGRDRDRHRRSKSRSRNRWGGPTDLSGKDLFMFIIYWYHVLSLHRHSQRRRSTGKAFARPFISIYDPFMFCISCPFFAPLWSLGSLLDDPPTWLRNSWKNEVGKFTFLYNQGKERSHSSRRRRRSRSSSGWVGKLQGLKFLKPWRFGATAWWSWGMFSIVVFVRDYIVCINESLMYTVYQI